MLQLKTIHDARHYRPLPSSARLHARSTSLLAPRRVGRDAAASGPGGGGCGLAARMAGSGPRAEPPQGRARLQKVAPPTGREVEVNVRRGEAPTVAARPGPDVERSSMYDDERARCAARVGEAVPLASVPAERTSSLVDAPRQRPTRTISHDFELVLSADTTLDGGVDTPPLRSPADEDEWEFLSFDHDDAAPAKSPTDAHGPSSQTAAAAPSAPNVAA